MHAQIAGNIWRQLLRRKLRLSRIRQQPAGQEMESAGQAGRVFVRTHAGRTVQQRAIRAEQEDAGCSGVVLRRRGSHGASEEHAYA